jgi:flagellar biosynthetic protein FliR
MLTVSTAELNTWIAAFLWPLTRILGLIATAPLFGNVAIPAQTKILLGALLAVAIAPGVPPMPAMDPMSFNGLLILTQQLIIGLAMGFAMRIVFAGVELAGEITGMTMGLGFATFFDPQSEGHSSAISQFLSLLTLMIYLATNMHLMLLSTLADSFNILPVAAAPFGNSSMQQMVAWGGHIFSTGVQLSLPIVAALLMTNIALGILTRAAPQLNLFGIGFPITIGVGFLMLALALPYFAVPIDHLFNEVIDMIKRMTAAALPTLRR